MGQPVPVGRCPVVSVWTHRAQQTVLQCLLGAGHDGRCCFPPMLVGVEGSG